VSGIVGSIHPQGSEVVRQRFVDAAVGSSRSETREPSEQKQKISDGTKPEISAFGAWIEYRAQVQKVFAFADAVNVAFLKRSPRNIALELADDFFQTSFDK
jgi:hypothetical protein